MLAPLVKLWPIALVFLASFVVVKLFKAWIAYRSRTRRAWA